MASRWSVSLDQSAENELDELAISDETLWREILGVIGDLTEGPKAYGCIPLERHPGLWRCRVQDYRMVYRVSEKQRRIIVTRIRHRGAVYEGLD